MKTAHLFGILAIGFTASACSSSSAAGSSGDNGQADGSDAGAVAVTRNTLTASFSLLKADGTPDSCSGAYTSVRLEAQARDSSNSTTGDTFTAVGACTAGKLTLALQTSGDEQVPCDATTGQCAHNVAKDISGIYDVTLIITDATGQTNFWASLTQRVDVSKGDAALSFKLYPNASFRLYDWGLNGTKIGSDLSCEAANIDTVRVTTTRALLPDGSTDPAPRTTVDTYPCAHDVKDADGYSYLSSASAGPNSVGVGLSSPLEYGYYDTKIEVLRGGVVIGTAKNDVPAEDQVKRDEVIYQAPYGSEWPFHWFQIVDVADH